MSHFAHILSQLQLFTLQTFAALSRHISDFSLHMNLHPSPVHFKLILFVYPVPAWHVVWFQHMDWLIPLVRCQFAVGGTVPLLTIVHDVLVPVKALAAVGQVALCDVNRPDHALVAQVAHEELETDEGEDAQAEDSQDHHIRKLLHRLDECTHNGLQAWGAAAHTHTQSRQVIQEMLMPRVCKCFGVSTSCKIIISNSDYC